MAPTTMWIVSETIPNAATAPASAISARKLNEGFVSWRIIAPISSQIASLPSSPIGPDASARIVAFGSLMLTAPARSRSRSLNILSISTLAWFAASIITTSPSGTFDAPG